MNIPNTDKPSSPGTQLELNWEEWKAVGVQLVESL